jgi:glycosyltransferase involved in cell wall biosynthesis
VRILLVQHSLDPPGGGNAVAAWMLQALAGVHELSTLTMSRWHPRAVDAFYGTSLAGIEITQLHPPIALRAVRLLPGEIMRLRTSALFRGARRHAARFDLLITADNYGAFGRPGLQYLHYPAALRPEPRFLPPLVHLYYGLCDRLAGMSWETARLNRTLANSAWTAGLLQRERGIAATVLYPPVVDSGPGLPWHERSNTFLCVGRFHGSKRFELAVSILARARASMPDLRLRIIGSSVDREYRRRLVAMVRQFPEWITIEEDLTQPHLLDVMRQSRYAIHAMENEHFGMAAAEMARAGCIVFVHDSGGQVEAVGGAPEVLWRTADEAVSRIRAVALSSRAEQGALSARLSTHAARFSSERFVREFRDIVDAAASIATPHT